MAHAVGDNPINKKTIYITFVVEDVGPTLYKCYTNVLCLLEKLK